MQGSLSKKCKDGKYRNYLLYFLNGVQILKQKIPFNTRYDRGTTGTPQYMTNTCLAAGCTRPGLRCVLRYEGDRPDQAGEFPVSKVKPAAIAST